MTADPSALSPELTLGLIAEWVDGRLEGDADMPLTGVAPVEDAGPSEIAFLAAKRYVKFVAGSGAGAFLVSADMASHIQGRPRVVVDEPYAALRVLLGALEPLHVPTPGVHPTAVLGRGVVLGEGVSVGPYAVLGDGARVGDGSVVDAHVVIGREAVVGEGCVVHPQVVLYPGTVLGDRVIIHSGTVLGADGFGYALVDGAHRRIPHLGRARIGDDVEIGANTAVDRGSLGDTVLEEGVKVDNLVQIAHNVHIGAHSMLAGMVGIAGSTRLGKGVWAGGQVGIINHLDIGDGARLAVATKVFRDVPPGETLSGHPGRPHREELRRQALVRRLPRLLERIEALEKEVEALRRKAGEGD